MLTHLIRVLFEGDDGAGAGAPGTTVTPPAGEPAPQEPTTPPAEEWVPPTREEHDRLQAAVAAANQRARALEQAQRDAAAAAAEAGGNHKELYEAEKARAEALEAGVRAAAIDSEVAAVARRLGFDNPAIAAKLADLDGVSATLDANGRASVDPAAGVLIERALAKVLEENPTLKRAEPGRQIAGAGSGSPAAGGHADLNAQIRRAAGR